MKKFIQNLREKPEEERQHILHISTFVCALLLLVGWSYSLNQSFRGDPDLAVKVQQQVQPFKELKANVIDGYNVISNLPASDNKPKE